MTAGSPDHDRTMHAALAAETSSVTRSVPVIRLVADLVCPWCYIAFIRLQRTLAGSPALLIWNPFLLNPNLPAHGVTRTQYLERRFGSVAQAQGVHRRVARAGAREGIPFAFGEIRTQPNTIGAHALVLAAATQSRQIEAAAALYQAFFAEGVDIGDPLVLASLAVQLGLSDEEVAAALGPVAAQLVVQDHERAFALGIAGVPVCVLGDDHLIAGAQPPEVLEALLDLERYRLAGHPAVTGAMPRSRP